MTLHPQSKRFIHFMASQNRPGWHEIPIAKSRELFGEFKSAFGDAPKLARVENRTLNDVATRCFWPNDDENEHRPVVIYFHGGGFAIGNLDTHDTLCRRLALAGDCVVVAVDYRLAPEHKYPAAADDCYAVTQYVAENATEFRASPDRLIVAGDSAGGNLSTAVALMARDKGRPKICHQILIYPVIAPKYDTQSYLELAEGFGLTRETMMWFWQQYLPEGDVDLRYTNLPSAVLKGLPPAHVITAEYDVLRDEGEAFVEQLSAAGVATSLRRYAGMLHGFIHFSAMFDVGLEAIVDIGNLIQDISSGE